MKALTRFIARRGVPVRIMSDHGSNFVAVAKACAGRNLTTNWQFILERSPHWGGAWERMIGVVKACLKRTLGASTLATWEDMETLFASIERTVNRRPISHAWDNIDGVSVPVPLCPEMFLLPMTGDFEDGSLESVLEGKDRWLKEVRALWKQEYFYQVLGASKVQQREGEPIQRGDVVLVGDESNLKRDKWKMGVVERMIVGRDGRCRGGVVRVAEVRGKKVKVTRLNRPVQKLYQLEIRSSRLAEADEMGGDNEVEVSKMGDDQCEIEEDEMGEEDNGEGLQDGRLTRRGRKVVLPSRFRI